MNTYHIGKYQFDQSKLLGQGYSAKVYYGLEKETGKEVAIKVYNKKQLIRCQSQITLQNEISILRQLQFDGIIQIQDLVETDSNYFIILDYCNGGTLKQYLNIHSKLSEEEALSIVIQIVRIFQIINSLNVIHRDLKPENIFFHNGLIVLGDFGFSTQLTCPHERAREAIGSPLYMCPQRLSNQYYSKKCDVWSLGILFHEMVYGRTPWKSDTQAGLVKKINRNLITFPVQPSISQNSLHFLKNCLQINEAKRYSWEELSQLKFVKSYINLPYELFKDQILKLELLKLRIKLDEFLIRTGVSLRGLLNKIHSDGNITNVKFFQVLKQIVPSACLETSDYIYKEICSESYQSSQHITTINTWQSLQTIKQNSLKSFSTIKYTIKVNEIQDTDLSDDEDQEFIVQTPIRFDCKEPGNLLQFS